MKTRTYPLAVALCAALAITVSSAPAGDVIVPWRPALADLTDWATKTKPQGENAWVTGEPSMSEEKPKTLDVEGEGSALVNKVTGHKQSWDIYSKKKFGSCRVELEVMVPKGANSGIYLMGEYEVQVLDSWGKEKLGGGDMGAIYGATPPKLNASKKPGEWQKYVIDFKAPTFDATGKKTSDAVFVKVELNGQVLHENVVVPKSTGGALVGTESPEGPIMFQGDHGPVAYRNIVITPKKF